MIPGSAPKIRPMARSTCLALRVTGALQNWLVVRGGLVDGLILRGFIPVSQRARAGQRIR
jgi:hypothetical protein